MPVATLAVGQQSDIADDDLRAVHLLTRVLIVPGTRGQTTLDVELGTLGGVVSDNLRGPLVSDEIVPFGLVLPLAALFLVALRGCQ